MIRDLRELWCQLWGGHRPEPASHPGELFWRCSKCTAYGYRDMSYPPLRKGR